MIIEELTQISEYNTNLVYCTLSLNFAHLTGSRVLLRVVRSCISLQLHDDHKYDEHAESAGV